MIESRLFRLAIESGVITFFHEPRCGWKLTIRFRRGDEAWAEAQWDTYSGLSTREMLDLIDSALDSAL